MELYYQLLCFLFLCFHIRSGFMFQISLSKPRSDFFRKKHWHDSPCLTNWASHNGGYWWQAQLGSTLETKPLTFAYLEPLFLHETRLLLMLDTWSMKPYTCMNFHTSSHLKILIQSKPSYSSICICTDKWILCFWIQTSMNVHPCHVWMEVYV